MNKYRDAKTGKFTSSPAIRTKNLISELYRAFDYFNDHFAEGKLPQVVITIQNKGRSSALGWFGNNFWRDNITAQTVGEINLSAEHLSRGLNSCMNTLLHEMAHLWNAAVVQEKDCSGAQYHNKRFKTAAEKFGLTVKRHATRGWATTYLDDEAIKAVRKLDISEELFKGLKRLKSPSREKKYVSLVVDVDAVSYIESIKTKLHGKGNVSQKQIVQLALESLDRSL